MGTSPPINILVDDRELQSGVVDVLRECDAISVDVDRLPLGDYLIEGHLLIERKTLVDLVTSIKDGRLFGQGCRLASSPHWTALILEGTSKDLTRSRMSREAVQGALITLTLFLGIPLLRSQGPRESAQLMLFAARQGRAVATGALPRPGRRPRGKTQTQNRVLQGLPGVGPERAKRLLERFGSLEAIMLAQASELVTVPGIGKATAEGIRWAVRESGSFYGSASQKIFPL